MKLHVLLVVGFVLGVTGCAREEQAAPGATDEAPMTESGAGQNQVWHNESFVAHMHLHAEALDELNFALADDDLEAAKTSANWLATHDTDSDIQADWMPHLYRMRAEAEAVEAAADIETAQAAAMRITAQCQECHAAVGVGVRIR